MSFLSPLFFWSFLSLLPLALIYLLKVRPRRKPTTAYFLWEDIFQERRPNRLLERLRDFWSLLLMALAFCAVCLSLTRPEIGNDQRKDVLLLIDNSASMNSIEGGTTRLELAKSQATEILKAFNGTQRAAVASVSRELQYKSHISDNPRELMDAVAAIEASDFEFRVDQFGRALGKKELVEAVAPAKESAHSEQTSDQADASGNANGEQPEESAGEVASEKTVASEKAQAPIKEQDWLEGQRVVLISDGCFDTSSLPERVELLKVGTAAAKNLGIVAADLRRLPGGVDRLGLYVQLHSTHATDQNVDLLVYDGRDDSSLFRLVPLQVVPGLNEPMTLVLEDAKPGAWRIRLDVEDALPNDNVAQLAVPKYDPIRVQVASDNRFFFENSVLAFADGSGLLRLVADNPDIVIDQGNWSGSDRALVFQPQGESPWWSELGDDVDVGAAKVLVEDHPTIRHIDVGSMNFAGAVQLRAAETAQVLVASEDGVPLIYRVSKDGKTAIIINMDPVVAEFYFSAWFPVLVHGSATHLAGRVDELFATYRPGDSFPIVGANEGEATQVTLPDATQVETTRASFDQTDQVGYYELKNASGNRIVGNSLLSKKESNVDNGAVVASNEPINQGWPLAHLLTALAVIVLGAESVLYHLRKVG